MAPIDVSKDNEKIVFHNLYKLKPLRTVSFKYSVGDKMRISKLLGVFRKGYEQTFTKEFFTITEHIARDPPVHKLVDCTGELVKGTFYEPELVINDKNKVFKIEKILTRKKIREFKNGPRKMIGLA